jgi:RND family efflux transporter MFP subunit
VKAAAVGEISISSIYTGKLVAEGEVGVVPKLPGKVVSVDVALGDRVSAGDVLFRLDPADVQLQTSQAQIQFDAAKSALDRADSAVKSAAGTVDSAEDAVKSAKDAVKSAKDAVKAAKKLPSAPVVSGGGLAPPGGTDPVAQAEAALSQTQVGYEQTKAGLEQAKAGHEQTKAGYEQANAQYKLASEGLNAANAALSNCAVTAPIDGYVTALNVQKGGMASQAMPSATISNVEALQIVTNVSENMVDDIAAGDSAEVYVRAVSEEAFAGVIQSVVPAPSAGTTTYPVVIELPSGDERLKPGMFAEIRIITERAADVVVVPSDAVMIKTGKEVVAVVGPDDKVRLVSVGTGLDDGSLVEIKNGLKSGDTVVYEGQYYLDEDSKFEIIE